MALDYRRSGSSITAANPDQADGWGYFQQPEGYGLSGYQVKSCLASNEAYNLTHAFNTTYDGNTLRYAVSNSFENILEEWYFSPEAEWAAPGQNSPAFLVKSTPQGEVFFDYVSSMRHLAPRDITISIKVQVSQDGMPQPYNEQNYKVVFPQDRDQIMYSCILGRVPPGKYQLTFLISDDAYTEDAPISAKLDIN